MACHLRSISMPSRSHSAELKCEEELDKLRACMASSSAAQMMCGRLRGLGDLYGCIEEVLRLPSNRNALSSSNRNELVEAELEFSVGLLDICSAMRDNLAAMKEHVQDVRSALRRGDEAAIESKARAFVRSSKKARKDIKKQIGNMCVASSATKQDEDKSKAIRLLTEAREITASVFQSILSFLSARIVKPKPSKWSLVSRTLHKTRVVCEEAREEDPFFFSPYSFKDNEEKRATAQNQLQTFEATIEGLESGLECLFRRLIRSRVSLLNILSS